MNQYLPLYTRFVGGWNVRMLAHTVKGFQDQDIQCMIDYVKENSSSSHDAEKYKANILDAANAMKTPQFFAVKMSGIQTHQRLLQLAEELHCKNHKLTIDAESVSTIPYVATTTDQICDFFDGYSNNSPFVFKTYQMYRKAALKELADQLAKHSRRSIGIKLVRGAYHHKDATSGELFTDINDTHGSYNEAVRLILNYMSGGRNIVPIFATHNKDSVQLITKMSLSHFICPSRFYFAQLMGMSDRLSYSLKAQGFQVIKYVPYGSICESVPYLVRRLHENPDMLKYMI